MLAVKWLNLDMEASTMLTWLLSLADVTEFFYAQGNLIVSLETYLGLSPAWRQKSSSASSSLSGQPTFLVVVSCYGHPEACAGDPSQPVTNCNETEM